MPLARRVARDDEEILCDLRPHPVVLVRPVLVALLVLAVEIAIFIVWASAPAWFGLVLLGVFLTDGAYLAGKVLAWRSTRLVVTSSRVIYRHGVLRRLGREIPLGRVQDVTYEQHLLQRLVRTGSLRIESAGEHGAEPIPAVRRPDRLQGLINDAIEACRVEQRMPKAAPGAFASDDVAELLKRLSDLYRGGAITEDEYAQKRAELLARM